jgi:hypothetical protein
LVDDADHEKGIASGALQQHAHDFARLQDAPTSPEPRGQIELDRFERQRAECDFVTAPMQRELRSDAAKPGSECSGISRTKRRQHHQAGSLRPAREMDKPVERRGVAPLDVFEVQDKR